MDPIPLKRDCFVTSVTLAALCKLGPTLLDMDPLLTRDACEHVFHIDKMSQRMFDKLNCGLSLIGTNAYVSTIEGFLMGTACMNNQVLDEDHPPFCSLAECAWGVWEYINLNGDKDATGRPTETFAPDIVKYIQETARLNGVTKLPLWLEFAQLPEDQLPDMSEDMQLFETYMARQQEYVDDLTAMVNRKQQELANELLALKETGYITPDTP